MTLCGGELTVRYQALGGLGGGSTPVRVALFGVDGRRVRVLVDVALPAGSYETRWDGRSYAGHRVAPGVYFLRIDTIGNTRTRQVTVVR